MTAILSRRLLLGGSVGAMVAGAVVAGGGNVQAADGAAPVPALPHRAITVGCWGGAYAAALQAVIDGPLAANAAITVTQNLTDEQARVTRLLSPGSGPRLDVAMLSDVDAYRMSLQQLFTPVTTDGVGMLTHVLPRLRVPYGVPQGSTALCIAYNPGKVANAPRGFAALFEAARKGMVGFSTELAIHNLAAAAIAQRDAGASLQGAKSIFLALKKAGTLRIYPTNEALGQALASGEITMAPMWRSRGYVWQQAQMDVRTSIPFEGAVPFTIMACVPHGGPAVGSAMQYLDALLHPDAQVEMARRLGLLSTVDNARIDAKLLAQIGFTAGQAIHFRPISLSAVAQTGVSLRRFWDHELA